MKREYYSDSIANFQNTTHDGSLAYLPKIMSSLSNKPSVMHGWKKLIFYKRFFRILKGRYILNIRFHEWGNE